MTNLTQADLDALTAWDTPTICNALELTSPERRATGFTVDAHGLSSAHETLVAYTSDQAHSSVEKAVRIAGLGRENLRLIETDGHHAMRPEALAVLGGAAQAAPQDDAERHQKELGRETGRRCAKGVAGERSAGIDAGHELLRWCHG